ncbi:MAG TPA: hypothetical protein VFF04_05390 [Candidatus Babeliales bacterium]|nr:hypothetical protein [Candidatus Babeliales bacterium]
MKTHPIITIWIHGTYPQEIIPGLAKLTIDPINRFFYCKPGLHRLVDADKKLYTTQMLNHLINADPIRFSLEHSYIFGWSGKLSPKERLIAAHQLHGQLVALLNSHYQDSHCSIRIITHSHGGNVALNLATIPQTSLNIDELILLACPVQKATESYITNPMFKQIYSIHSHLDMIQILDPQGLPEVTAALKNIFKTHSLKKVGATIAQIKKALQQIERRFFFSRRHFAPHKKLLQVHISLNKHRLLHGEFLLPKFMRSLPTILNQVERWEEINNLKIRTNDLMLDISTE